MNEWMDEILKNTAAQSQDAETATRTMRQAMGNLAQSLKSAVEYWGKHRPDDQLTMLGEPGEDKIEIVSFSTDQPGVSVTLILDQENQKITCAYGPGCHQQLLALRILGPGSEGFGFRLDGSIPETLIAQILRPVLAALKPRQNG